MKQKIVQIVEEEQARRVANIMGPQSAYARALADMEARRARGEITCLVSDGESVLVVPQSSLMPASESV